MVAKGWKKTGKLSWYNPNIKNGVNRVSIEHEKKSLQDLGYGKYVVVGIRTDGLRMGLNQLPCWGEKGVILNTLEDARNFVALEIGDSKNWLIQYMKSHPNL